MFQVNKDYDFTGEVLLEIDKNVKVTEVSNEEMIAMVTLHLMFF